MPAPIATAAIAVASDAAKPLTKIIVEKLLAPRLTDLLSKIDGQQHVDERKFLDNFQGFLNREYESHAFFNTVVFETDRRPLLDFYVPLTLTSLDETSSAIIDHFDEDFINKWHKILITDTAGMGKSTVLTFLFLESLKSNTIPIFLELRRLKPEFGIVDFVRNSISDLTTNYSTEFVLNLIQSGGFTFFFDAYDEIHSEDREEVTRNLSEFISRADLGNNFLLTTRPESHTGSFASFAGFKIRPLERHEAYLLIEKYDKNGATSAALVNTLESDEIHGVHEFLGNPLLCSLLYRCYQYKRVIPLKRSDFYRQVYDALFDAHDLSKGEGLTREKLSGLTSGAFHSVLKVLGFQTLKIGVEYDKETILRQIEYAKSECPGCTFDPSTFLNDLLRAVPLFKRDGTYYRWTHRSIQEYFAALFICEDAKSKQDELLQRLNASIKIDNANVLSLCYDIDSKSFRRSLLLPLFERFIAFAEADRSNLDSAITDIAIGERRLRTFGHTYILLPQLPKIFAGFDEVHLRLNQHSIVLPDNMRKLILHSTDGGKDYSTFGVLEIHQPDETLIEILKEARSPIVIPTPSDLGHQAWSTLIDSIPSDKPILVNESSDSIVNKAELFEIVTSVITSHNTIILDIQEVKKTVAEILLEAEKYNSGDLLFDGL